MITHLYDKTFESFIDEKTIDAAVKNLATQIFNDYHEKEPTFLSILNGSFMFTSDLLKNYNGLCSVSFIKLASYIGEKSTGNVKSLIGLDKNLEDKTIIILEDIIDTGNTLSEIISQLKNKKANEIKVCSLFFKPDAYKKSIPIDYIGIKIPNKFIVGYGLDYNGLGRNLSHIYKLKT